MKFESRKTSYVFSEIEDKFETSHSLVTHSCSRCFVSVRSKDSVLIMWCDSAGDVYYVASIPYHAKFFPRPEDIAGGLPEGVVPDHVADHLAVVSNVYQMGLA